MNIPDRLKMNGNHAGTSKSSGSPKASDTGLWKNVGSVPRDPKSRARSREYLKQYVYFTSQDIMTTQADQHRCLQEITYLTSPGALNPIPNRPLLTDLDNASPKSGPIEPEPERPTKSLPSRSLPSAFAQKPTEEVRNDEHPMSNGIEEKPQPTESSVPPSIKPPSPITADPTKSHLSNLETSAKPPSSPLVRTKGLPLDDDADAITDQQSEGVPENQTNQLLTAIYRPESKAAWREELRAANEKAIKVCT